MSDNSTNWLNLEYKFNAYVKNLDNYRISTTLRLPFLMTSIFEPLYFVKMGPIFVSSSLFQLKKNITIHFNPARLANGLA